VVACLRPSNIDLSRHSRAILKMLVAKLGLAWPEVNTIVRTDSGFCRWQLMRWCDRRRLNYILGMCQNALLESVSRSEPPPSRKLASFSSAISSTISLPLLAWGRSRT
jgi:hypothetical protein